MIHLEIYAVSFGKQFKSLCVFRLNGKYNNHAQQTLRFVASLELCTNLIIFPNRAVISLVSWNNNYSDGQREKWLSQCISQIVFVHTVCQTQILCAIINTRPVQYAGASLARHNYF